MQPNRSSDAVIPPKVVAIATDRNIRPLVTFGDASNLRGVPSPRYGQDITSGTGRAAPGGESVGRTPEELKPRMRRLLEIFAQGDRSGMAARLFDAFLADVSRPVEYFEDHALNVAAASHPNITAFCSAALSAPNSVAKTPTAIRIHQALRAAGWDLSKMAIPTDLGVPAFNLGSKAFSTQDFNNGLGVMINSVQHAYVVATNYSFNSTTGRYRITLKYLFYDVFGLDDEDLAEYGTRAYPGSDAASGVTAWWQLQHQHGYAPLVTRVVLERTHESTAQ